MTKKVQVEPFFLLSMNEKFIYPFNKFFIINFIFVFFSFRFVENNYLNRRFIFSPSSYLSSLSNPSTHELKLSTDTSTISKLLGYFFPILLCFCKYSTCFSAFSIVEK